MADGNDYGSYPLEQLPIIAWVNDYTDGTAPASADALYEYSSCKDAMFNRLFKFKIYPKTIGTAFSAGTAYTYQNRPPWFRTNYLDAYHYGFKMAVYGLASGQALTMRMRFIYYFSLKSAA